MIFRKLKLLVMFFSLALSGCGGGESGQHAHTHNFSEEWSYNETYHWHECDGCSEVSDKQLHRFGIWVVDAEPTSTTAGSKHRGCTVCPYVETASIDPTDHEHEYSTDWKYNSSTHWHECSCGAKKDEAYHTFDGWVVDAEPTSTTAGSKHRGCTVCPYTEEQVIEPTGETIYATGITIFPKTATVEAGKELDLIATLSPEGSVPWGRIAWEVDNYSSAYIYENGAQGVTARFSAFARVSTETNVTVTVTLWTKSDQVSDTATITIVPAGDPGPGPLVPDDYDPNPENETVNHMRYFLNDDGETYRVEGLWDEVEEIIIPARYKGLPVTKIGELFIRSWTQKDGSEFNNVTSLKRATIPTTIVEIHESAWFLAEHVKVTYSGTKEQFVSISEGFIPDGTTCSDGVLSDNLEGPEVEEGETIDYNGFKIYRLTNEITFNGYYGNDKEISIPATYNGFPVKYLSLTSPTDTPITIETIHQNSLHGMNWFDYNYIRGITKFTYGYNTRSIGNPFGEWSSSAHFEECMFEIDSDSRFKIDDNGFIISKNDPSVILNSNGNVSGSVIIPEGVKAIGQTAFYKKNISSVSFPSTLETIGRYAFAGTSLTSVTTPNSVETIDEGAFKGCGSLQSVVLSNALEELSVLLFEDCVSLSSIEIPNSVVSIGYGVFDKCSSLASITIPNSVTSMENCFYMCVNLASITLSNSLRILNASMFYGCIKLETVNLPSNLEEIGSCAFEGCRSLESITLPSSLLFIGGGAFLNCSSLSNITLPNGLLAIGEGAFMGCTSLDVIAIPDSVEEFGACALYSIPSNSFSSSERYINENGVLFNKNKTWLYHYDFNKEDECYEIPNTVEVIDGGAFVGKVGNNLANLKAVIMPKSVKYVLSTTLSTTTFYENLHGFSDFNGLTVFYKGNADEWDNITIYGENNSLSDNRTTICFYSASQPGDTTRSYWHYVDGVPTKW